MCLRLGIAVLLATLSLPHLMRAQSQACVDSAPSSRVQDQETKINIVGIEFHGENPLSDALRARLANDIQHSNLNAVSEDPDSSWVDEATQPIRSVLQEQGYFKNSVVGTPYLIRAEAHERRYVVRVEIESGPKYRLGKLGFASVSGSPLVFSGALLKQHISLQVGDVFDVSKIRQGLDSISKLYGARGYIDATVEPDTEIDDDSLRIDLIIRVDEERPYSVGRIEIQGLDTKAQNKLKVPQESGDIFNFELWENFFRDNQHHLPLGASLDKNLRMQRNFSDSTVDIILDFRPCPKTRLED
jgi:outer membrane protein assembly factor BamA